MSGTDSRTRVYHGSHHHARKVYHNRGTAGRYKQPGMLFNSFETNGLVHQYQFGVHFYAPNFKEVEGAYWFGSLRRVSPVRICMWFGLFFVIFFTI